MKYLIIVNLIFAVALGFMVAFKVTSNPIWLAFLVAWCIAEGILAKDASITWKQWALLLISLGALDGIIILTFGH